MARAGAIAPGVEKMLAVIIAICFTLAQSLQPVKVTNRADAICHFSMCSTLIGSGVDMESIMDVLRFHFGSKAI